MFYAGRVRCKELSYNEAVFDSIYKTIKEAEKCGMGVF